MSSAKQTSHGTRFFFARIFPLLFIVIGALTLYFGGRSLQRAKESVAWPTAEGRIQSSDMEYHREKKGGGTYHAEILYTFAVNGETHSGNKIAFGDYGSGNPSHAQHIVNRYPANKIVQVRYLASDPDICVLEPGIQGQAWILPGIGLVFLVAGILLAISLPKAMRKRSATD
jgi:hypothetical protein